jgi:hypothetical protein
MAPLARRLSARSIPPPSGAAFRSAALPAFARPPRPRPCRTTKLVRTPPRCHSWKRPSAAASKGVSRRLLPAAEVVSGPRVARLLDHLGRATVAPRPRARAKSTGAAGAAPVEDERLKKKAQLLVGDDVRVFADTPTARPTARSPLLVAPDEKLRSDRRPPRRNRRFRPQLPPSAARRSRAAFPVLATKRDHPFATNGTTWLASLWRERAREGGRARERSEARRRPKRR